jgi:hypothetical protein
VNEFEKIGGMDAVALPVLQEKEVVQVSEDLPGHITAFMQNANFT